MNAVVIFAVLLIGFAAGLRGLTPPAVIAWLAYLGWISLANTPFSFISSPIMVAGFSVLAMGEYVWDLLPNTPSRTAAPGLISRILTGAFAAACLLAGTNNGLGFFILGALAAIAGAFTGLQIRVRLVRALAVNDAFVAIPEDLIAVGLSIFAVCIAVSR
ncbi:MAG: hypothetical protein DMF63_01585 [Acidobacteria bacterium]|nr:MAG: hypothetical protein DMF63_01585 [Acidobacteriota bacterium]